MLITLLATYGCNKEMPPGDKEALAFTKKHSAVVATSWYRLLTEITRTKPYAPPQTIRILSYTGITLYESVVRGMPSYQSMYTHLTGNIIEADKKTAYYWPAAANAAIARISSRLMSNYPSPNLSPLIELENAFNNQFAIIISPELLNNSIAYGQQVADFIYAWSTTDGTLTPESIPAVCPSYTPLGGPGNWIPTPPGFLPAAGACQGQLRTFLPGIINSLPVTHPVPYSTEPESDFFHAANEIYQISFNLTPDDIRISQSWRDLIGVNFNAPGHILRLTSQIVEKENMDLEKASVLFAKQGMAMFDAIAVIFKRKFEFSLLRPVTYIRNVQGHSNWNSLYPTPQHPSYPAVAPGAAGAAVVILEKTFGYHYNFLDSTQHTLYGTWTYSDFDQMLEDVGKSRTLSGINFQFAVNDGKLIGRRIGEKIDALPFKKL
jgi:hypothetical protein